MTGRLTTLNTCSCQWIVAFGGLPCRHMLHLHISLQSKETDMMFVRDGILDKWCLAREEDTDRSVAEQRCASASGAISVRDQIQ